jgi:tyrosine-protein phosphatase
MSPRAEEFTRNPFHVDFLPPAVDASPASSNETIKVDPDYNNWKEPQQWTPQKSVEDPRSPVQTGGSPIVRNIWDVL